MESPGEKSSVVRVPASGASPWTFFDFCERNPQPRVVLPRYFCLDALKNFYHTRIHCCRSKESYDRIVDTFWSRSWWLYTKLRKRIIFLLFYYYYYFYYYIYVFLEIIDFEILTRSTFATSLKFLRNFGYVNKVNEK